MDRAGVIRNIELMDDASVEAVRRLGGEGRLHMVDRLTAGLRELMAARAREQHPEMTEDEVQREVSRRIRDAADS
jgi:hypothetical protein